MIDENQSDWDKKAQFFLMGYRALPHATTGISPGMQMLGRSIQPPANLEYGISFDETVRSQSQYVQELRETLAYLHEYTSQVIRNATFESKRRYDLRAKVPDFQEENQVYLYEPKNRTGFTRKLMKPSNGPYMVVKKLSEVTSQIRCSPQSKVKTVPADRMHLYKRAPPPLPVKCDEKQVISKSYPKCRTSRPTARVMRTNLRVTVTMTEHPQLIETKVEKIPLSARWRTTTVQHPGTNKKSQFHEGTNQPVKTNRNVTIITVRSIQC